MRPHTVAFAALLLAAALPGLPTQAQGPLPSSAAFTSIVHGPATETSFTLDRSMLAATDGFFNGQDPEARRVAAGLNSITIHNYHYRDGASYDPGAFAVSGQRLPAAPATSTWSTPMPTVAPVPRTCGCASRDKRELGGRADPRRPQHERHRRGLHATAAGPPSPGRPLRHTPGRTRCDHGPATAGAVMVPAQPPAGAVTVPALPPAAGPQAQSNPW